MAAQRLPVRLILRMLQAGGQRVNTNLQARGQRQERGGGLLVSRQR